MAKLQEIVDKINAKYGMKVVQLGCKKVEEDYMSEIMEEEYNKSIKAKNMIFDLYMEKCITEAEYEFLLDQICHKFIV